MTTSAVGTWRRIEEATTGPGVYPEARPRRSWRAGRRALGLGLFLVLAGLAPSCKGVNLYSLDQDMALGAQTYQQVLQQEQPVTSGPQAETVMRVTDRLVAAVIDLEPEFAEFEWEATLLQSDTVNAFCLPGGKMAVYTGILPFTQDDAGLAVVMGHEIAHATRRHGTEKMTRSLGLQAVVQIASMYGAEHVDPEVSAGLLSTGLSVLVDLPYGRDAELEADRAGLVYMASAGYDPRTAPEFWRRMSAAGSGAGPEWLSTHPSDERRIEQLEALLPEAIQIYEAATPRP
jgi:predicted Zn-dependent protease